CTSVLSAVEHVLKLVDEDAQPRLALHVAGSDPDQEVPVPRSMLETAIRNLVENALRYSPDSSPVDVTITFEQSSERCCIAVADRGPGLTEEQAPQIGRRFWRGDQGRHRENGAGLGISIVHAIAERFGGKLTFEPREGGGLV